MSLMTVTFTVPGEPVSKARARFTSYGSPGRAYTPEKTRTAEQRVGYAYRQAGGRLEADGDITFAVHATFYNGTRQRRDVDNMLKLILDGLNKVAWADDVQVVEVSGRKLYAPKSEARTVVEVVKVGRMERLTKPCEHCGEHFETWPSLYDKTRWCGAECRKAARRAARTTTCEQCGTEFLRHAPSHETRFCSVACKSAAGRVEVACTHCGTTFTKQRCFVRATNYCTDECAKARAREKARAGRAERRGGGTCETCGGWVSKPTYRQCSPCKRAASGSPTRPAEGGAA